LLLAIDDKRIKSESDSNLKYAVGLSQFKKLVLITMFAVA